MSGMVTGFVVGISIAAPVGPIGVLCIRRTLQDGRLAGFVSGIGAATADACYGIVAALGLTALAVFLTDGAAWLNTIGAAFLLYLAYRTARSAAESGPDVKKGAQAGYWSAYGSTFLLTLTNPMTIVSFAGIIAGLNLGTGSAAPYLFVLGVFTGSAVWWLMLGLAVGATKKMLPASALKAINYGSAVVLAGYGAFNLFKIAVQWA